MIISGTITAASPPSPPQGQYSVMYQDITITNQQGQTISGRIGSKQGYATGAAVQVTVEEKPGTNGPYNYFKKYNPQYAQQGQQQGGQQAQQGSQRAAQQPSGNKDLLIVRQVAYKGLARVAAGSGISIDDFHAMLVGTYILDHCVDVMMKGNPKPSAGNQLGPPAAQGQANPNFVGDDPPPPTEDDIPF